MMKRALATLMALLWISLPAAQADSIAYTDFTSWSAAVSNITTLDFETPVAGAGPAPGSNVLLNGNEYIGLAGSPTLSLTVPNPGETADTRLQVGKLILTEVAPNSGTQLLYPGLFENNVSGNGGILRVTTTAPVNGAGAYFSDIESGESSTGFDLDLDGIIDVLFADAYPGAANPGEGATVFFAFTTNLPVSTFDVHINSANRTQDQGGSDGVGLDDLSFAIVPAPAAAGLFGSALALLGLLRRRA